MGKYPKKEEKGKNGFHKNDNNKENWPSLSIYYSCVYRPKYCTTETETLLTIEIDVKTRKNIAKKYKKNIIATIFTLIISNFANYFFRKGNATL